jgi:hypothetical protein
MEFGVEQDSFKSYQNNRWHEVEFKYTHTNFTMEHYKSRNPIGFDIWPLNFPHVSMIPEELGERSGCGDWLGTGQEVGVLVPVRSRIFSFPCHPDRF